MEVKEDYLLKWKTEINQKTESVDFTFWYDREDLIGKKK